MKSKRQTPSITQAEREPMTRVYSMKSERVSGFCPICFKPVDIILSENTTELFGICCECGNMLFYSQKPSTPESTIEELLSD